MEARKAQNGAIAIIIEATGTPTASNRAGNTRVVTKAVTLTMV